MHDYIMDLKKRRTDAQRSKRLFLSCHESKTLPGSDISIKISMRLVKLRHQTIENQVTDDISEAF